MLHISITAILNPPSLDVCLKGTAIWGMVGVFMFETFQTFRVKLFDL